MIIFLLLCLGQDISVKCRLLGNKVDSVSDLLYPLIFKTFLDYVCLSIHRSTEDIFFVLQRAFHVFDYEILIRVIGFYELLSGLLHIFLAFKGLLHLDLLGLKSFSDTLGDDCHCPGKDNVDKVTFCRGLLLAHCFKS